MATTSGVDPRAQRSDHDLDDAPRQQAHTGHRPDLSAGRMPGNWDIERFASERAIGLYVNGPSLQGVEHRADKDLCL